MSMSDVRFLPWVPAGKPQFAGHRLLLIGESQYDDSGESDFGLADVSRSTEWIINRYGIEVSGYTRFHANVYTMLTGNAWEAGSESVRIFWESVFFYNYIQVFVGTAARQRPTSKMFKDSHDAFRQVVSDLRPDRILVLGETLWNKMDQSTFKEGRRDTELGLIGTFKVGDSHALAAHTAHPSSVGFSASAWHPKVSEFLRLDS